MSEATSSQNGGVQAGLRQCPTQVDAQPLIAHRIEPCVCLERQRQLYHKCHKCVYRGEPANWVAPAVQAPGPDPAAIERATVTELPRPQPAAERVANRPAAAAREPEHALSSR